MVKLLGVLAGVASDHIAFVASASDEMREFNPLSAHGQASHTDKTQVASCVNVSSLVEGIEMRHSSTADSPCRGPAAVGRTMFTPLWSRHNPTFCWGRHPPRNLRVSWWNAHTESHKVADGPSPSPATSGGKRPGKPDACYQCGKRSEGENPMCGGFMRVLPRSTRSKPLRRRRTSRGEGAGRGKPRSTGLVD